jgi:hypothetical protein
MSHHLHCDINVLPRDGSILRQIDRCRMSGGSSIAPSFKLLVLALTRWVRGD